VTRATSALAAAALIAAPGCGGDGDRQPTVAAAASLKQALTDYEPGARYSFAGSDQLAAQIRSGVRPDAYAAANTELPRDLHRHGLVERPLVFARNRLVLATRSPRIRTLADAARAGTSSEEPDIAGVLGKIQQGAVDAGFVYATDARAARLRAVRLPNADVSYAIAVVRPSAAARAFVRGLLEARGRRALLRAGFRVP
jgi:molybdate transport system substrate-binding protein